MTLENEWRLALAVVPAELTHGRANAVGEIGLTGHPEGGLHRAGDQDVLAIGILRAPLPIRTLDGVSVFGRLSKQRREAISRAWISVQTAMKG